MYNAINKALANGAKEEMQKSLPETKDLVPSFKPETLSMEKSENSDYHYSTDKELSRKIEATEDDDSSLSPLSNEIPTFDSENVDGDSSLSPLSNEIPTFDSENVEEQTEKYELDEEPEADNDSLSESEANDNAGSTSDGTDNNTKNNEEQQIEDSNSLKSENQNTNLENVPEDDKPEKKGGSYGEVFKEGEGDTHEVHHMPADSASNLERNDGPAIKMEKEDHRETASCGSSKEAREYREEQKKLIEEGKFREALQMDIDDIHEKFGDKYDDAIAEMLEYVDKLEEEGKING